MATDPRPEALRALATPGCGTTSARLALAGLRDAVDPATLPPRLRERAVAEMERGHAEATTALAFTEIEKALKDAWVAPPTAVLDALEPEPVACTPTAQVHRGVSRRARRRGEGAAARHRRPGPPGPQPARDAHPPARRGPSPPRAGVLLREVRERVLDELDLEHEASTQQLHVPAQSARSATSGCS